MDEKEVIKKYFSELGKKGSKSRAKKLSAERRKEIATKASHSRKIYKDNKIT